MLRNSSIQFTGMSVHFNRNIHPHAENILEISGIGENILSGILAEMGDRSRFDDAAEIQKLSGLGLVASSSGKHKGETKISHRVIIMVWQSHLSGKVFSGMISTAFTYFSIFASSS